MAVLSGTLEEIANQVNDLNIKATVLVAYDYENQIWRVVKVNSDAELVTTT